MRCIEIQDGKHKGELGVVVEEMADSVVKVLTLEGDCHYYDRDNQEIHLPSGPDSQPGAAAGRAFWGSDI